MIGNDIIDLELALQPGRWKEQRFWDKVLTLNEQSYLQSQNNSAEVFWRFWSMKEAAYKAHQRKYNLFPRLNPFEFDCVINDDISGTVSIEKENYYCRTFSNNRVLHSIVRDISAVIIKKEFSENNARFQLITFLSKIYNGNKEYFSIIKSEFGIPQILYKNKILPINFSLSHHGKYSGFSLEVNELLNAG